MVDAHALRQLVGEVADFLTTSWGRQPVHVPASEDRDHLTGLVTLDDADHLVAASGLRAPAFRLVKQGRTLPQSEVTRSVRIGSKPVSDLVDVAAVHAAVADGATLVLQGLHRSFAPVMTFCRDLERTLTHPVQANAYLTPPVAQGLNLHGDPHDVFAIQTYGSKRWVVHPPDGSEPWDLRLTPGDVLYLPAGTRHAAQTIDTPSLHLTIGVRTVTWRQLVDHALRTTLAELTDLDRPLPVGWADEPDVLQAQLQEHLGRVASELADPERAGGALRRGAQDHLGAQPVDRAGGLRDLLELDLLDDTTPLRRREGATGQLRGGQDPSHLEVVLADRTLRVPATLEPSLRSILDGTVARPADLDPFLDEPSRRVLCRRLVREGLLTMSWADGPAGG